MPLRKEAVLGSVTGGKMLLQSVSECDVGEYRWIVVYSVISYLKAGFLRL